MNYLSIIDASKAGKLIIPTYATFAGFPAASGSTGGVAYATDTLKFYYSNGTDWIDPTTPKIKSGVVAAGTFAGNPKKATVTFTTAFADANYSVSVIGIDARTWSIETIAAGSFVINSNANTAPADSVRWTAIKHGEN